ncbi:MAG: NYN domain-containing protein [Deltaproteobacteria bacterium]|jgi:uncharacterized LabA/DUF88 family protein|nr:NYN domain-containing protein [Deltaproteobacteria bacterium]
MQESLEPHTRGMALFIDIENVIGHCSTLGLPVHFKPICEKINKIAPLRVRKAFGDIPKTMSSTGRSAGILPLRKELAANLIEIQDVPYLINKKNSADIHIVATALSLAYENPNISHFTFVTTDRDYVPLYNKLKELGKLVVVISIDESATPGIAADAADQIFYYEHLPEISRLIRTPPQPHTETEAVPEAKEPAPMPACAPAAGTEPGHLNTAPPSLSASCRHWSVEDFCAAYKQVLEMVLKTPFPSLEDRKIILKAAEGCFADGMDLREWTGKTAQRIREADNAGASSGINDAAIFKILLALYFNRAFHVRRNLDDANNPVILGFVCPTWQLGEYLDRNYVSIIMRKTSYENSPEALAQLLYEDMSAEAVAKCEQYIDEMRYLQSGRGRVVEEAWGH